MNEKPQDDITHPLDKIVMYTVSEWEEGKIDFVSVDEIFLPVLEEWWDNLYGPFLKCVAYCGVRSGQVLHPEFGNILESM